MRRATIALAAALTATVLVAPPAAAGRSVTITGGGWGHGIGMSQYGAYGRALNGKDARAILTTYYSGTSVTAREMPRQVRVGLLQAKDSISLSSSVLSKGDGKVIWKVQGRRGRIAAGTAATTWRVEPSPTGGTRLYKNGRQVERDGRTVFGDATHALRLIYARFGSLVEVSGKGPRYRHGKMDFGAYLSDSCAGGQCLRLVVSLPMQKYLYGLGEVPSSWPQATLQAQAIAGRTYAFEKVQRSGQHRDPCDCAVYDSTLDQAYTGDSKRDADGDGRADTYWDEWKGAVDATNDLVVLHNGGPIAALYSSSSGGHTENNENVWGGSPLSYLRGVRDEPDRAEGRNPNFTWSVEMTYSEFESKLNAAYNTGSLESFDVVKPRGVSGRVTVVNETNDSGGVRIVGSRKTQRTSGWSIRSALSLKDTLFWVDIDYDTGGRFERKYQRLDGAPGEPLSDVYDVPRRAAKARGKAQDFERGRMTWIKARDKIVWQWGKVLRKYDKLGREKSALGMPASDVWGPGRFRGATYGRGIILWSRTTGAHSIRGVFRSGYRRNGGVRGHLGLPTRQRQRRASLPDGGVRQRFESGTLYRPPERRKAFALWGDIDVRYRSMGEARSRCGYPTGDMSAADGIATAAFENGLITRNSSGEIDVSC